jgi:hypothetical protein
VPPLAPPAQRCHPPCASPTRSLSLSPRISLPGRHVPRFPVTLAPRTRLGHPPHARSGRAARPTEHPPRLPDVPAARAPAPPRCPGHGRACVPRSRQQPHQQPDPSRDAPKPHARSTRPEQDHSTRPTTAKPEPTPTPPSHKLSRAVCSSSSSNGAFTATVTPSPHSSSIKINAIDGHETPPTTSALPPSLYKTPVEPFSLPTPSSLPPLGSLSLAIRRREVHHRTVRAAPRWSPTCCQTPAHAVPSSSPDSPCPSAVHRSSPVLARRTSFAIRGASPEVASHRLKASPE